MATHQQLLKYIAIHNEIYGASPWRSLRRLLPIPGFCEAIPYPQHSVTLQEVRRDLEAIRVQVTSLPPNESQICSVLLDYLRALQCTVSVLQELCDALADKAAGASYTRAEYNAKCAEYEKARLNYVRLGGSSTSASRQPREA